MFYAIQNPNQVESKPLKRIVDPCTVLSKAGSVNPLLSSSLGSWSFCSKFKSPVEGALTAQAVDYCVFLRDNVRLPE